MDSVWAGDGREAHDRYKNAISSATRAAGMSASEEAPKGFGRCDVFVPGRGRDPSVAVEVRTSVRDPPAVSAQKARSQIFEKGYASEPQDGGAVWIAIGINGKRASVITPFGFSGEGRRNS